MTGCPERSAAWHVAMWVDIAPAAPFTLRAVHGALDPLCGGHEVERVLNALITRGLITRADRAGRVWRAPQPLLTREG